MAHLDLKKKVGPVPLYVYLGAIVVVGGVIYIRTRPPSDGTTADPQGVVGPVLDPTNGQAQSGIPTDGSLGTSTTGEPPAPALSDVVGLIGDLQNAGLLTVPGQAQQGTADIAGSGAATVKAPNHSKPPTYAQKHGLKVGQTITRKSAADHGRRWIYKVTSKGSLMRLRRAPSKKKPPKTSKHHARPKVKAHATPKKKSPPKKKKKK